jgi:hypothetical protein
MGRIKKAVREAVAHSPEFISTRFAAKLALITHILTVIGFNHNLMMTRHLPPIVCCRSTRETCPRVGLLLTASRPHPATEPGLLCSRQSQHDIRITTYPDIYRSILLGQIMA